MSEVSHVNVVRSFDITYFSLKSSYKSDLFPFSRNTQELRGTASPLEIIESSFYSYIKIK